MLLHASDKFAKRLQCAISDVPAPPTNLNSWSSDVFQIPKIGEFALVMNNYIGMALAVPLEGVQRFEDFLPLFLQRVAGIFDKVGADFEIENQSIAILRRKDRRQIAGMTAHRLAAEKDIPWLIKRDGKLNYDQLEYELNERPLAMLNGHPPALVLFMLISDARAAQARGE